MANHALVFGASGSAGWSVIDELLDGYPSQGSFATATAMINRPLSLEASGWKPSKTPSTPKLQIGSGMNLTAGRAEELAAKMKDAVPGVEQTTHVFYCAFIQRDEPAEEARVNGEAMERLTGALNLLCPHLQMFVLSEGTRFYHRQCTAEKKLPAPFREEMTRWCTAEEREGLFYFAMEATLERACEGKAWSWCGIIPDAVIGFAPSGSTFALQLMWGTWLSLIAQKEGKGAKVYYPGSGTSYKTKFNEVSAAMFARAMIWAGLNPDKTRGGQQFNIADRSQASSMDETFPKLCAYFGLEAQGPPLDEELKDGTFKMPSAYVKDERWRLEEMGLKPIEIWKGDWLDAYGTMYVYDRNISLEKLRVAGFVEERDPIEGWYRAFDKMKEAGMIPA